jgi:hypothetical protein
MSQILSMKLPTHPSTAHTQHGVAISQYAEDNPDREDLAETMLLYLAFRFWPERIPSSLRDTVLETVFNRILYLDCQNLSVDIV